MADDTDSGSDYRNGVDEITANLRASSDERIKSLHTPGSVAQVVRNWNKDGSSKEIIRAKKTDWISALIRLDGQRFDFSGRSYLKQIYNLKHPHKLLITGRQVEKCLVASSLVSLPAGSDARIDSLVPGDKVMAMSPEGTAVVDTITASESNGVKECLRIKTAFGSVVECTYNHPLRKLLEWVRAGQLKVGDHLATFRSLGRFEDSLNRLAEIETLQTLGLACNDARFFEIRALTLSADIIWDEITSIEPMGEQPTWSIQTETETYISDFIVQHNSTMLANEFITNSVVIPYFKSLYVSPSHDQTRQFSNGKLKPWIDDSPIVSKYFQSSACSSHVFEKSMTNGSIGFLRSAFLNADRCRGLSADQLFIDELQDVLLSNIAIIAEALSHSKYGYKIYSGTPKTLENTIQQFFTMSSMCEWLVPCHAHSPPHWNYLDTKNIGKNGPICNKCGKLINPADGKWVAFNKDRDIMGFRISQLMVPWFGNERKWKELLFKYETYSKGQFHNEVLGISYDSATKPITRAEIMACCSSKYPFRATADNWVRKVEVFAGVDWGEGTDGSERGDKGKLKNASYTVLTLGTYIDPNHFHIFYYKRYTGKEAAPSACVADILKILHYYGVKICGVDWGHGWGVNERIEEAMGPRRVIKFQHVGGQKMRSKYDDIGHKYQLGRTEVMTDMFIALKDVKIVFPAWDVMEDYLKDFENIYAEYNEAARSIKYDHRISNPDDAFHSAIYCYEAAKIYYGK